MRHRLFTFVAILAFSAAPAFGQGSRSAPSGPAQAAPAEPQRRAPDPRHQSRVDQLFERLAAAGSENEARLLADQIDRVWARSGSDTLDLLLDRARQANAASDRVAALDLFDSILALKTDWAEAYNRRASVHFQNKDFDAAMRDLRQTLALEPRHYQAMAGVGLVFQQNGDGRKALSAFRKALQINPYLKGIREAAEKLSVEHDDQGI
ncbi:MAG: tetratricopeptide repeat protein [Beijerinckiaceae bacterium]